MSAEEPREKFQWTNVLNQYFATIAANLIMLNQGCTIGWVSPALPILTSKESPLIDGALENVQVSWVGSINCMGSLFGSLSFGYIIALMGSKRAITLLIIPSVAFWLLIYFGNVYYHILLARFIAGWAGGSMQTSLILYISEIANDNVRGRLASIPLLFRNIGTLIGYSLGATVDYHLIPCICVIVPFAFAICFIPLTNTPQFYLRKGNTQKAERALKFYKGYKGKNETEVNALHKELERLKNVTNDRKTNAKFQASDLWNRNALNGIGIAIALATFSQVTAGFTIISYSVKIFQELETSMDPHLSSFILAISLIFGSLASTYLADKLGRKFLNAISLSGSAFGLFATSLYHYLSLSDFDVSAFELAPIVSLSFVIFISSAGIWGLALVSAIEYLPHKIRTIGMSIAVVTISLSAFISAKIFPILMEIVGLHGCLTVFGIASTIGAIFVWAVMKETSGKSLDDVELNKPTKTVHRDKTEIEEH